MTQSFVVPSALDGERLDRAVALLAGWPRAAVQALLDDGNVLVDGRAVAKSHRLREGAVIELLGEPEADAPPEPDHDVELDVRYVDDDLIVVYKPADLVVHPGAGHARGTLVNGLLARFPDIAAVGIDAKGKLRDAKVGDTYDTSWAQNGMHIVTFHAKWKRKNGKIDFGLTSSDSNVRDGKYGFVVLQKGKTVGKSSMTLASSSAAC